MPTPRAHYKERIAHAEGYEIEVYEATGLCMGVWELVTDPDWSPKKQYRVKPESKPDVVIERHVKQFAEAITLGRDKPNLRLTFDGETGALKSAEVING